MIITANQKDLKQNEKNALKSAIGKARNEFVNTLMDELGIAKGAVEAETEFSFRYGTEKFAVDLYQHYKENRQFKLDLEEIEDDL